MVKLIHTADVHLDSPLRSLALRNESLSRQVRAASRSSFRHIIDLAIEHEVAALLICGDLFDGNERSAKTAAFLTAQLDRLNNRAIKVFYIKGNHDAENPITRGMDFPSNMHVFGARGGKVEINEIGVCVHGVSFGSKHAPESLLPKFGNPAAGMINIGMLHSSLAGSAHHNIYAPCTLRELSDIGFDYWALGHIHARQIYSQDPWIVMPGIPQGRDAGESGPKSATLINIEDQTISISELSTSEVEFGQLEINATGLEEPEDLRKQISAEFAERASSLQSPRAFLTVHLKGTSNLAWQVLRDQDIWSEFIREIAEETERLWIDKLKFELTSDKSESRSDASAELLRIMDELCANPNFRTSFLAEAEELISRLPGPCREALAPNPKELDSLVERLAHAGKDRMAALLSDSQT